MTWEWLATCELILVDFDFADEGEVRRSSDLYQPFFWASAGALLVLRDSFVRWFGGAGW